MSEYAAQTGVPAVDPHMLMASAQQLPPDEMPQVMRELTMLKGTLDAVHRAARDIVQKTAVVQRQVPEPDSPNKLSEAFPVSAPLAEELRALSNECSQIESILAMATHRIEL